MKRQIPLKKLFFLLAACSLQLTASSQYWQQKVDYVIDVKLNDREKTLDAFEKLTYYNNSPDTLYFIWFHLWPNAYKNDKTAFSDQELENGNTKFYFSGKEERGYINRLDFKVDGLTAKTEDHPQHIDITKLILPKALPPGQKIIITTPFHVKLPFNFSRGGYDGESFQVTQWFPKPAVYDNKGWHPMPYLDQGEFFSEFGDFDVSITVPQNYTVAATGQLQNEKEKMDLHRRSTQREVEKVKGNYKKVISYNKGKKVTKLAEETGASAPQKTLVYKQANIHDFAWFADKAFIVNYDTCSLSSGRIIDVYSFYTSAEQSTWKNSLQFAKDALRFYSNELGEYPYDVATVVQGPQSFGGGMEYPTITVISPTSSEKELDITIAHELGHNWFYGILATNERDHPWMDEGMNSFYEEKYTEKKYGSSSLLFKYIYETKAVRKTDQPIETTSEKFSEANYGVIAYYKTAAWLKAIEKKAGEEVLKKAMQAYFEKWKFKHPYPEDFENIVKPYLGSEADPAFKALKTKGLLPGDERKGFALVSPFKKGSIKSYLQQPTKNILFVSPVIGVNSYDRLMVGGLISNYKLPPNNFSFFIAPMYATGSKNFTGIGKFNYSIHSDKAIRKADIFLNASTFTMDEFKDTAGRKIFMQFQKIVPGIRLTFKEKEPRSTVRKYIQWKTFLIKEQSLNIDQDTTIIGTDTTLFLNYLLPEKSSWLNQLQFVYTNYRALYPFDINFQIEQAQDFLRPALTANYFFNYKEGGLQFRFFAGKFIYLNGKTIRKQFDNDRYFLNMTGAKGYEDYTYSDYFLGRNKFEGLESQQIMIRDGGFKVRTDLLASKIGKTDNWLAAINLSSSIPDKFNPLSVLPVKIPLRVFLDIGTHAEAWEKKSETDRILYDAGLQIPVLHETINIYIPILYNKAYSDYFKSTIPKNRLLKTISFTIQFYNKEMKEINRELEF